MDYINQNESLIPNLSITQLAEFSYTSPATISKTIRKCGFNGISGFAEYICPPEENVYKIPDYLSLKYAALTEPLSCCLHGIDLLDLKVDHSVVIIGMGFIGNMM